MYYDFEEEEKYLQEASRSSTATRQSRFEDAALPVGLLKMTRRSASSQAVVSSSPYISKLARTISSSAG